MWRLASGLRAPGGFFVCGGGWFPDVGGEQLPRKDQHYSWLQTLRGASAVLGQERTV